MSFYNYLERGTKHTYKPVPVEEYGVELPAQVAEALADEPAIVEVDSMGLNEYLAFKGVQTGEVYKSKNPFGERGKNERIISTGAELRNKEFCIGIWSYMQVNSKNNQIDDFRYIKKEGLVPRLMEEITNMKYDSISKTYSNNPISKNTILKGIKYLKDNGFIVGEVEGSEVTAGAGGTYYKLKNKDVFKYYTLLENEFLKTIVSTLNQDVIKVYLAYYGFNTPDKVGVCYLSKEQVLERIGLTNTGANKRKLTRINTILDTLGLIKQDTIIYNGKPKLVTVTPYYWETSLYKKVANGISKEQLLQFDNGSNLTLSN